MFDFNDIRTIGTDNVAYNDFIQDYIGRKVEAILTKDDDNLPTVEEMTDWPDGIWKPNSREELKRLIKYLPNSLKKCNLNWIDTSEITDMGQLFYNSPFNGDISRWDVSNVTNMKSMFSGSEFNGDISRWDVSNVKNMSSMFSYSEFTGNISGWNASNVINYMDIFFYSKIDNIINHGIITKEEAEELGYYKFS